MTEHLKPTTFPRLFRWMINEFNSNGSIFNIPSQWFYRPSAAPDCASSLFGHRLSTPVGPAAGPHTQLAQNIISAWLCGARYVELKTVQIMDELEIPRPCIDMTDEGYNVEWSQELRLHQSALEYIHAWVIIHLLPGFLDMDPAAAGTVFNISVGYNLEGLKSEPMRRFLATMANASEAIKSIRNWLRSTYPEFAELPIPDTISDNVTLSTMHGCPPGEIQRIAEYLMSECGLHTFVKLNPTLLGKQPVIAILKETLGYDSIEIPDSVFAADPSWAQAVELIQNLEKCAISSGKTFGIKLSNTLAMRNTLGRLPGNEMYMSGRALFPVTVNLFARLQETFDNRLNVSFSAGADAMNLPDLIAAGAFPVTVASDLLKPGGYGRLRQYVENLETGMKMVQVSTLPEYRSQSVQKLKKLASDSLANLRYRKEWFKDGLPKLDSKLQQFDCITAPCSKTCPAEQNPPAYIRKIVSGELEAGFHIILRDNPLPGMTGYVCPHQCQRKCTRNAYDRPVAIRNLKRYIRDNCTPLQPVTRMAKSQVAIIGAGPAGLSAAAFLAEAGIKSTIFEASAIPGGIPRLAPGFRLPDPVVRSDVDRIISMGVELLLNHPVPVDQSDLLKEGYEAVFMAPGFQRDIFPDIPGADGNGVIGVLEFLSLTKEGESWSHAVDVVVIGGGNAAMDAARTARRLTGHPATVIYRRTRSEMPAWDEEVTGLLEEGNQLLELLSPVAINREDGFPVSVTCIRNELGSPDPDGRRKPVPVPGSEIEIPADLVIIAIGQKPEYSSVRGIVLGRNGEIPVETTTGMTRIQGLFAGGDAVRGPASIIEAVADGHRAARTILRELGMDAKTTISIIRKQTPDRDAILKARIRLEMPEEPSMLNSGNRQTFDVIEQTLDPVQAAREAARCLQCDLVCDRCVDVCPNRANQAITVQPSVMRIPSLRIVDHRVVTDAESVVTMQQDRQIIHIADWCNECGNCATFCTHSGEPFRTKAKFWLDSDSFEVSGEDAWFASRGSIKRRAGSRLYQMIMQGKDYLCRIDNLSVVMTHKGRIKAAAVTGVMEGSVSLEPAAEMILLWDSIQRHPIVNEIN